MTAVMADVIVTSHMGETADGETLYIVSIATDSLEMAAHIQAMVKDWQDGATVPEVMN